MTCEISGDSPQAVAYKLLEAIAIVEGKQLGTDKADKEWILQNYKECLDVVLSIRRWGSYS